MQLEHTWRGISGRRYDFQIYQNPSDWPYWGGVYMLCGQTQDGWKAHCIGECDNLQATLNSHLQTTLHSNAINTTQMHFLLSSEPAKRKRITADLIVTLETRCYQSFILPEELIQVDEKPLWRAA